MNPCATFKYDDFACSFCMIFVRYFCRLVISTASSYGIPCFESKLKAGPGPVTASPC